MTEAHSVTEHLTLLQVFPDHSPRESDPHYATFHQTRERLKRLGALKCWIDNADCDHTHPIELHHSYVEFALANIVDAAHFARLYPEFSIADDEAFLDWVEGPDNLLALCKMHHVGICGIHVIHHPAWIVQRYMKDGVSAPERKIRG